ncbi:MAG: ADYC domain-containing protein, partial [Myxococcota bacterium]
MRITRAVVAMAWVTACSPSAERNNVVDRIETQSSALTTYNGVTYNGISYAGRSLTRISGLGPNGTSLYDALAIGIRSDLVSESLYDGTLDMAMFDLTGTLEDGEEVELRINDVEINEDGRPSFSVSIGLDGQWTSLCSDSEGDERRAIAVPGVWKTISGEIGGGSWASERGAFSFACRNSSIEKCVRLGYGPEDKDFFGRPYRLLACVRMLRADYCGDGQSWTTDGRLIEAWDDDDINSRTEPDWPREAGWTPEGASC